MAIVGRRTVSIVVVSIVALNLLVLAPAVSAADPGADLSLTKTVDVPDPEIGQQVTFTLTVTNTGSDDATLVAGHGPPPCGAGLRIRFEHRRLLQQHHWRVGRLTVGRR